MIFTFAPTVKVDFFITSECPICRRYSPDIGRIIREFPKAEFRFVFSEPGISQAKATRHLREFKLKGTIVLDPKGVVARRAGAKIVPTATVWKDSKLTYRGRIDDAYGSDYRWRAPKTFDLKIAIGRALNGTANVLVQTTPTGCSLSF